MAELVDALDSKSGNSNVVWVRFPLRPPKTALHALFFIVCYSVYAILKTIT